MYSPCFRSLCQLFSRHVGVIAPIDTTRMQVGGTQRIDCITCNIVLYLVATHFALCLDHNADHRVTIVAHEATVDKAINGEETLRPCANVLRLTGDSSILKCDFFDHSQHDE